MMGVDKLLPCTVQLAKVIQKSSCDVLCIIDRPLPQELDEQFADYRSFDKGFDSYVSCFRSTQLQMPVVYSPLPELTDYHDVNSYKKAAAKSLERAIKGGFKSPLLVVPQSARFPNAELCTVLGALEELYVPIALREEVPEKQKMVEQLTVMLTSPKAETIFQDALMLESGLFMARDIGGGDPERMTAIRVEEYVRKLLPELEMKVISDVTTLQREYPLFAAVDRAAHQVPRHQGRIIFLEYKPPKPARKTLMLVGKGVTYDTGGADIKAGGVMAGMSRDKCGAAAVAGFMQVVQECKPSDIHVVAALCMVRNSVGEECYVSDEVITSRAGCRVRIGNTDAEGRLCMADALCQMKEMAVERNLPDPHLFTVATLTGHAVLSAGLGFSIAVDNSVAQASGHALRLQALGEMYGEPFEVSTLRQRDFEFNEGKMRGEDVLQCNNQASSRTERGHQVPVAFLLRATGLDKHGLRADKPLKYTHLDIAASAGDIPQMPTGAPIVALVKTHIT